ncbi:MAG: cell division protein [Chitinophagaceae bacterium]|nr:MAG: cell division protein [Chitinophagaceae bacterium]
MPLIHLQTFINASPETVFDLSRSVDLHKASMTHHREEIIDGMPAGLMGLGDTVTWKANHLFRSRTLKVKITALNPPEFFADEMIEGDFKQMRHEHAFKAMNGGTLMIDRFLFTAPFGMIGTLVSFLFLKRYMTNLLEQRNQTIKDIAESTQAKQYLHT